MRRIILPALAVGISLVSAATVRADTQYTSWQGQWRISETGTEYPAGFPKITDHVITVAKDDGKALKYTDHWKIGDKADSSSFDGAFDGKPYKTSDGHMMAYEHVSANAYQDHWTDDMGTLGEDHCTFTPDGLHMNCTGAVTPKGGQKATYKEHWDKIQ